MTTTRRRPLLVLTVLAAVTTACSPGGTTSASPDASVTSSPAARLLDPAQFAETVGSEERLLLNVHVPDEGSLPGTDAAIPYDRIQARTADLPADRSAPLAVYCKTGRMSAEAVTTLRELGYRDVVELRGGMDAWVADGRELLPPAA